MTTAATGALVNHFQFILVALFAALFLKEALRPAIWAGFAVLLLGTLLGTIAVGVLLIAYGLLAPRGTSNASSMAPMSDYYQLVRTADRRGLAVVLREEARPADAAVKRHELDHATLHFAVNVFRQHFVEGNTQRVNIGACVHRHALAQRLLGRSDDDDSSRIDLAYRLALARPPTPKEMTVARELVEGRSLDDFANVMLNLNEFLYME